MLWTIRNIDILCSEMSGTEETSRTQGLESCASFESISHHLTPSQKTEVLVGTSEEKAVLRAEATVVSLWRGKETRNNMCFPLM